MKIDYIPPGPYDALMESDLRKIERSLRHKAYPDEKGTERDCGVWVGFADIGVTRHIPMKRELKGLGRTRPVELPISSQGISR